MAEIKNIDKDRLSLIIAEKGFLPELLTKDYYITFILYILKEIKGVYFKGGTAINKILLNCARLSEDIDFSLERNLKDVKKEIISIIDNTKLFSKITKDKDVEGFTRLIIPYHELGTGTVFIDLNERSRLLTKPETKDITHFYPNIPKFSFPCISEREMIAEKMAATIGRNKPRDHYDLYMLLKNNYEIDLDMVKKKCEQSGDEFSIIRMFNRAKKLRNRWDDDMVALLSTQVSFQEVMKELAKHFKLKEEKEKLKDG